MQIRMHMSLHLTLMLFPLVIMVTTAIIFIVIWDNVINNAHELATENMAKISELCREALGVDNQG